MLKKNSASADAAAPEAKKVAAKPATKATKAEAAPAKAPRLATKAPKAPAADPKPVTAAEAPSAAPGDVIEPEAPSRISRKEIARSIQQKVALAGKAVPLPIAELMVVAYEETITEALKDLKEVSLPGFGRFQPSHRPAVQRRNPLTGESVEGKAHYAARFKVGAALKAIMQAIPADNV